MPSLVVSYSHTNEDVDLTLAAIDGALDVYRRALDDGVEQHLIGRPTQTVLPALQPPRRTTQKTGGRSGANGGGKLMGMLERGLMRLQQRFVGGPIARLLIVPLAIGGWAIGPGAAASAAGQLGSGSTPMAATLNAVCVLDR